jgi:adenylyl-sulfate kinase
MPNGVCIWFTGLSGAGKSTVAAALVKQLAAQGRSTTLLDGDVVRAHLSKGLGFSRDDRDANVLRIGYVATEIVRHGGIAVCAAISPYRETRERVRGMIEAVRPGAFVEVFVDTSLAECERRDVKGLYAKARRGELTGFTGIDDPYEPPAQPEVRLDTQRNDPEACARQVCAVLPSAPITTALARDASARAHALSFAKGVSWRFFGSLITALIVYLVTGRWELALSVGLVEVVAKIGLYYVHDRLWEAIYGRLLKRKSS